MQRVLSFALWCAFQPLLLPPGVGAGVQQRCSQRESTERFKVLQLFMDAASPLKAPGSSGDCGHGGGCRKLREVPNAECGNSGKLRQPAMPEAPGTSGNPGSSWRLRTWVEAPGGSGSTTGSGLARSGTTRAAALPRDGLLGRTRLVVADDRKSVQNRTLTPPSASARDAQEIRAKDGDAFVGEGAATVLSGARVLSAFGREGGLQRLRHSIRAPLFSPRRMAPRNCHERGSCSGAGGPGWGRGVAFRVAPSLSHLPLASSRASEAPGILCISTGRCKAISDAPHPYPFLRHSRDILYPSSMCLLRCYLCSVQYVLRMVALAATYTVKVGVKRASTQSGEPLLWGFQECGGSGVGAKFAHSLRGINVRHFLKCRCSCLGRRTRIVQRKCAQGNQREAVRCRRDAASPPEPATPCVRPLRVLHAEHLTPLPRPVRHSSSQQCCCVACR
eukprot:gene17160-biopygen2527